MTAGFPAAAEAAAALYKQGKITAYEAEKLASFSHYCSPVLIVIVVGTAYMKQPELGLFLLGIHWASGLSAAVTMNWLSLALSASKQARARIQNIRAAVRLNRGGSSPCAKLKKRGAKTAAASASFLAILLARPCKH